MSLDVYLEIDDETVFEANITHNLSRMADAAGIYEPLWRPDEIDIMYAGQLINPLSDGLKRLKGYPEAFKILNASNGWGLYKHFVPWIEQYLQACVENPTALVTVSR